MYAWIWRHLPGGSPAKLAGALLLVAGVLALLWYAAFPWAERTLPVDRVDVHATGAPATPGSGR